MADRFGVLNRLWHRRLCRALACARNRGRGGHQSSCLVVYRHNFRHPVQVRDRKPARSAARTWRICGGCPRPASRTRSAAGDWTCMIRGGIAVCNRTDRTVRPRYVRGERSGFGLAPATAGVGRPATRCKSKSCVRPNWAFPIGAPVLPDSGRSGSLCELRPGDWPQPGMQRADVVPARRRPLSQTALAIHRAVNLGRGPAGPAGCPAIPRPVPDGSACWTGRRVRNRIVSRPVTARASPTANSYLTPRRRRFSPREIMRLLCFRPASRAGVADLCKAWNCRQQPVRGPVRMWCRDPRTGDTGGGTYQRHKPIA